MALPQSCLLELFVGFAKMCTNQNSSSEQSGYIGRHAIQHKKAFRYRSTYFKLYIKCVEMHTVM